MHPKLRGDPKCEPGIELRPDGWAHKSARDAPAYIRAGGGPLPPPPERKITHGSALKNQKRRCYQRRSGAPTRGTGPLRLALAERPVLALLAWEALSSRSA